MKMLLPSSFIIFLQVLTTISHTCKASAAAKFTTMLVFGDSSVDTGNNNYVLTSFQANHYPYGQNYPGQVPTGRFSDGKLIPDFIASSLGIKESVPPFLDPLISNDELRTGVNFASAGSGFDELTTAASGVIPFATQILYFKSYIERLKVFVGEAEATKIINGALVIISAGTNDFAINFYTLPTRRLQFTVGGYQDFIQSKIKEFVQVKHASSTFWPHKNASLPIPIYDLCTPGLHRPLVL
jgi:phospholipase/lecithinase/hemolysin